jgi:RNA-binding protein NOB1
MNDTSVPVADAENREPDSAWEEDEEERKKKSLQPMVNGRYQTKKVYNSFRKYGNVVSAGGSSNAVKKVEPVTEEENPANDKTATPAIAQPDDNQEYKSRIIGSAGAANANGFPSEMTAEDDDGEGWVTCTRDIQNMKATGSLQLNSSRNGKSFKPKQDNCPPISQRAACATTDFAMQNVILQMNLELLSVDGVRVRRLKTWVTRCGACFTIYGGNDQKGKSGNRLFCDKCGSNALQRIAASVDRNSGRLKLHMKKNYQYNTRGTKFALPKAGNGNKYEGDLLLAEDQLMFGAWGQKVRKGKSKTSGQSIFGSDLASDLGCHTDLTKRDDIKVGFGRRNPNSSKFGRERRGKKKKNTKDKACGLRRY